MHDLEPKTLSAGEKRDRLRLAWSDHVGPITFRHLIARYGSAGAALEALPDLAAKGGSKRRVKLLAQSKAEDELANLEAFGGQLLVLGETAYPKLLATVEDAPPVLFVSGHARLFEKDSIAIVGARNASSGAGGWPAIWPVNLARLGWSSPRDWLAASTAPPTPVPSKTAPSPSSAVD